jgi:hypothetical protein
MHYVAHKFPNLSKVAIHLGTHLHQVTKGMCRESFQEMKNMVVDEVCHKPTATSSTISLSMSKIFHFHHLFNEDGKGPMELLKGEKLNQTLLKFTPLCSLGRHNLIVSLNHRLDNPSSLNNILKLKVLFSYDYILRQMFSWSIS